MRGRALEGSHAWFGCIVNLHNVISSQCDGLTSNYEHSATEETPGDPEGSIPVKGNEQDGKVPIVLKIDEFFSLIGIFCHAEMKSLGPR